MQLIQKILLSLTLGALWLCSNPVMASNTITRLDCHESKGVTCTMSSNATMHYHYFFLQSPPRLVFDFKNVGAQHFSKVNGIENSVIRSFRYAYRPKEQVLRVVFDLNTLTPLNVVQTTVGGVNQLQLNFKNPSQTEFQPRLEPQPLESQYIKPPVEDHVLETSIPQPEYSSTNRKVMIVIDPGHGGKDPGATGLSRSHEKDVVLLIAKKIQKLINQQPGFTAVLTRQNDVYLTLRERLAVARKYRPDMFVAIHADAYPQKYAIGASVYALSLRGATSEAAHWLADKENESELMGGVELSDKSHLLKSVLLDLSQSATIRASLELGRGIIHSLSQIGPLHHENVEQAAFVVLKSPDIPSLLIETGFITNPSEERKLNSVQYQKRLASSITRGICDYFIHQPPRGTWLAQYRFKKSKYSASKK